MGTDPISYRHPPDVDFSAAIIQELVVAFYARVRTDAVLGPVFANIIDDWDSHIEKVSGFWRYVTKLDSAYNARDFIPAHLKHPQIQSSLLPRWLLLFRQTARDVCPQRTADHLIDIAERMATSLEMSLARRV